MAYTIRFRKRAAKEYFESVAWYKEQSLQSAENFVLSIDETIKKISDHPSRFRKSYKEFYEVRTKKYPFKIIYFIDPAKNDIVITSIFHQRRNPNHKF